MSMAVDEQMIGRLEELTSGFYRFDLWKFANLRRTEIYSRNLRYFIALAIRLRLYEQNTRNFIPGSIVAFFNTIKILFL